MNDLCDEVDKETLHLHSIEDMIYGLDINQHAINIGASALTLIAPNVDYNKMNLYCMQHGKNSDGEVRTGSLDLLIDDHRLNVFGSSGMRTSSDEFIDDRVKLDNSFDLVIMNPPYTRNDLRNQHYPPELKREIQQREKDIAKEIKHSNTLLGNAISNTSIATYFFPIANGFLNKNGAVATVLPFASSTNPAAKGYRNLLTNKGDYILELVVTSHDNNRIYFSGNTTIHECLVIAKKETKNNRNKKAAFISLYKNPSNISQAIDLAESIKKSLQGNIENLKKNYGNIIFRDQNFIRGKIWNDTCFYDFNLSEQWNKMLFNSCKPDSALQRIEKVSKIIDGRVIRGSFSRSKEIPHSYTSIWYHNESRNTLLTNFDSYMYAKNGKESKAQKLWEEGKTHLFIAQKIRWSTISVLAPYTKNKMLGNACIPIIPTLESGYLIDDLNLISKAWCLYLNSTYGILGFLNTRGKDLQYSLFSIDTIKNLLIPNSYKCDINSMANTFDKLSENELKPISLINSDKIRNQIDDCVFKAVPGLFDAEPIREKIANEPSVHQRKK
ncbi:MAG: hypothetical protein OXC67_03405 [Flavobacteriaceae bacterium]|nr:hypothetical protein [Flavobacteriaceae bacterium]